MQYNNMKLCPRCKHRKLIEDFYGSKRDRVQSWCKQCKKENGINLTEKGFCRSGDNNPLRSKVYCQECLDKRKSHEYQKQYGITLVEKNKMWKMQNGLCGLCKLPMISLRDICVDHNHKTKKVRKLLHSNCNTMIGLAHENIILLQNAIDYLKAHL